LIIPAGAAPALRHDEIDLLRELVSIWQAKRTRNVLRTIYYEGKNALKDFGVSIPPRFQSVEVALQWIAKGVHGMTDRSVFEGFVSPATAKDPFGVEGLIYDNAFDVELPQAQVSSAIHSCAFLTVTQGDVQAGEPEVLILPRSADDSAALWDNRRRALKAFLSVTDTDGAGFPTGMVMHTPEQVLTLTRRSGGWTVTRLRNPLGEVAVAPLVLKPELKRPFGHSRITRAGMHFTDAAIRTILRAEVSAEFYSAPEYWLFGADPAAFANKDKWTALMGRIKSLEPHPETDENPELHRFEGASPQPHESQLRMWAMLFAGDQGLSVSSLGIIHDNPSSADAIYAAKEDLIVDTRNANGTWGRGAVKAMQLAIRLRDGLDTVPDELKALKSVYTDPAMVSPSAAADAFTKRASVIPGFATSEVGLETAGLSREQIIRFRAERDEKARMLAPGTAEEAAGEDAVERDEQDSAQADAAAVKAKADALGILIRSGVDAETAARLVGLDGVKFTGAVPVSLRMPEDEARSLEE
jgi:hypothetical protein